MDALEAAVPRRGQSGPDLSWMVAVIIDDAHVRSATTELKTAVHAAKVFQRLANAVWLNVEPHSHGHGRRCVQHVVIAGNAQVEISECLPMIFHRKMRIVLVAGAFTFGAPDAKIRV